MTLKQVSLSASTLLGWFGRKATVILSPNMGMTGQPVQNCKSPSSVDSSPETPYKLRKKENSNNVLHHTFLNEKFMITFLTRVSLIHVL